MFLLLFAVPAKAQINPRTDANFVATYTGTAPLVTIQNVVGNSKTFAMQGAYLQCASACTITEERNGAVTSGTAVTIVNVNVGGANAVASVASVVRGATVTTVNTLQSFVLPAGSSLAIDLTNVNIIPGTNSNLSFRVDTGTATIGLQWLEQ